MTFLHSKFSLVNPGHEHDIALTSQVFTDNDIKVLNPSDRDCFFADEGNLELYEKYTLALVKVTLNDHCSLPNNSEFGYVILYFKY